MMMLLEVKMVMLLEVMWLEHLQNNKGGVVKNKSFNNFVVHIWEVYVH